LKLQLLGPFEACLGDDVPVAITGKKAKALLAYLALAGGQPVSRDKLAGVLWEFSADEQARTSLRQTISSLRKCISPLDGEALVSEGDTLAIDPKVVAVDALDFEALVADGTTEALEHASALYRGDLLDGMSLREEAFEAWLRGERARYRELALGALATLFRHCAEKGECDNAAHIATRLLGLDPLREDIHRALMRLYAEQGQRGLAVKQYEQCRDNLRRELDVAPAPETEALYQEIKEQSASPDRAAELAEYTAHVADEAPPLPDKPSIAVLPFTNMSGDPDQEYFSDGITEDIITDLSRFRSLFVVARNSSFAFRGNSVDIREVGRSLGVRFVLEGSVRMVSNRVRITAQLIDAGTTNHIWGDRYDGDLADVFAVQDEISHSIVSTIAGRLEDFDADRVATKPTDNLSAYENFLRGQKLVHNYTRDDYANARRYFEHAISLDPNFARARAWLADVDIFSWFWDLTPEGLELAFHTGEAALALDDHESKSHLALGLAQLFRAEHEKSEYHLLRASELNPNDDLIMIENGRYMIYVDEPQAGADLVRQAMRRNPYHPNWYWNILGRCLHTAKLYDEAISALERIRTPQFWNHAYLAACYAELGQLRESAKNSEALLALKPDFTITEFATVLPYRDKQVLHEFLAGLHQAGLPA